MGVTSVAEIVDVIWNAVSTAFYAIFIPYHDLRAAKEGTDTDQIAAVFEAGADEYLIKPIDHLALVARVKSALRMKELHDRVVGQAADLAVWNRELEQRVTDQVGELERVGRLRRFLAPQIAEAIVRLSLMNVALQRMSVI
jgi:response regulator RpfG family c-di-GMP phosphodiesterase